MPQEMNHDQVKNILKFIDTTQVQNPFSLHFQEAPTYGGGGMAGAEGSAGRSFDGVSKQTGSRRDKIPEKPLPMVVVRDFEVCHSLFLPPP